MNEQGRKLILGEVAKWRDAEIIDDAAKLRIQQFYPDDAGNRRGIGFVIFASSGALLIGLGIIALFAANWSGLSRGMRAVASVSPVVASALICLFFKTHGKNSLAFMEPSGLFWGISTDVSFDFPIDRYYTDEKTAPKIEGLVSFRSRGVVSNACAVVRAYKGSMLLEDLEFNGVPALEYLETPSAPTSSLP